MDAKRAMLLHFLAALAYRTQKALHEAPPDFADFSAGNRVRSPRELVHHMTNVMGWAHATLRGESYLAEASETFQDEIARFHAMLNDLSGAIHTVKAMSQTTAERLLQGPFSDAMTHAGQLAMLRRLFGSPVPPENFFEADVDPSNLGADQPAPKAPGKEWPEGSDVV